MKYEFDVYHRRYISTDVEVQKYLVSSWNGISQDPSSLIPQHVSPLRAIRRKSPLRLEEHLE